MAKRCQKYRIEQPLSPNAHISSHPNVNSIIQYAIGLQNPIDIDVLKSEISNSIMVKHPRFCSLLVQDRHGREFWVPTKVALDKHIIIVHHPDANHCPTGLKAEEANKKNEVDENINEYIAGFAVSSPLCPDRPLWEIHVLVDLRCLIFRIHHAIGDGTSIMSMIWALGKSKHSDGINVGVTKTLRNNKQAKKVKCWRSLVSDMSCLWFSMVFGAQLMAKSLWLKDDKTVISGGKGVELWPRRLVTARFCLEDMKTIKTSIPNATINDVLLGMIWFGLSKYLDLQYHQEPLRKKLQITGSCKVNLREQPGLQEMSTLMKENSKARWGNKFGGFLLPIKYRKGGSKDPMDYLKRAKQLMDRKKHSKEAHLQYLASRLLLYFLGQNVAAWFFSNLSGNTTFQISNIMGPAEEIVLFGNPVTFIRANGYGVPQAIVMHLVSYAGSANLQILVAKDIVPNPELLAKCFEDALMEMKNIAVDNANRK